MPDRGECSNPNRSQRQCVAGRVLNMQSVLKTKLWFLLKNVGLYRELETLGFLLKKFENLEVFNKETLNFH